MKIEIYTHDTSLPFYLFDTKSLEGGESVNLGDGVVVTYQGTLKRYALDWPDIVQLSISVAASVPAAVVASLIYDWLKKKFQKKPEKLTIEDTEIEFEEQKIIRIIQKTITIERK